MKILTINEYRKVYENLGRISIDELTWNKDTNTFSGELSDLYSINGGEPYIRIYNNKTSNRVLFNLVKVDKDGSGEDIYGWNYESEDKKMKLLIIND